MNKTLVSLLVFLFSIFACKTNLTSPSGSADIIREWSPYIGVHPFANHTHVQEPHLDRLIQSGNLRGVRLDGNIRDASDINILVDFLSSRNVEILGVFPNEYLRGENVLDVFSQTVNAFPMIEDWEIGNEVGHFVSMDPEEYMPIFKMIFYFAKTHFPEKNIIAEAPVGAGSGALTFKKLLDLGLAEMFQDGLTTVAIHFYSWKSARLDEFKSQISRLPANRRIWVTETNADQFTVEWADQVRYVKTIYPRLKNSLGAERIYWYTLAGCDNLSLVKGLPDQCSMDPPLDSPLMNFLVRDIP